MLIQPQSVTFPEPLRLECGRELRQVRIGYETYGTLAPERNNAILVCHALTRSAHAAGRYAPADPLPGWWDAAIGEGRMLDTRKYFVICSNVIGGCDGSTGPASPDPATGRPYALRFPMVTVGDMVRAQRRLLEHLGIERLVAVLGGCFGGQQALQWAIRYPDRVGGAVVISTTASTSAHTIAIFHVLRRLIREDPAWNGGDYYGGEIPRRGLTQALVAAVPFWMSRQALESRFARRLNGRETYSYSFEPEFEVEAFLERIGSGALREFDPNSLLYLTRAEEYFDLAREHGNLEQAVRPIRARVLLISYRSDWRYPPVEVETLQAALTAAGADSRHVVLDSLHGHGAFQVDLSGLAPRVQELLASISLTGSSHQAATK